MFEWKEMEGKQGEGNRWIAFSSCGYQKGKEGIYKEGKKKRENKNK